MKPLITFSLVIEADEAMTKDECSNVLGDLEEVIGKHSLNLDDSGFTID